jgi:hypothetical protein
MRYKKCIILSLILSLQIIKQFYRLNFTLKLNYITPILKCITLYVAAFFEIYKNLIILYKCI